MPAEVLGANLNSNAHRLIPVDCGLRRVNSLLSRSFEEVALQSALPKLCTKMSSKPLDRAQARSEPLVDLADLVNDIVAARNSMVVHVE